MFNAFDTDGFTLGSDSDVNGNSATFVLGIGKQMEQGSSNSDGIYKLNFTSANTTSGFSIIKYTGTWK